MREIPRLLLTSVEMRIVGGGVTAGKATDERRSIFSAGSKYKKCKIDSRLAQSYTAPLKSWVFAVTINQSLRKSPIGCYGYHAFWMPFLYKQN